MTLLSTFLLALAIWSTLGWLMLVVDTLVEAIRGIDLSERQFLRRGSGVFFTMLATALFWAAWGCSL